MISDWSQGTVVQGTVLSLSDGTTDARVTGGASRGMRWKLGAGFRHGRSDLTPLDRLEVPGDLGRTKAAGCGCALRTPGRAPSTRAPRAGLARPACFRRPERGLRS